MDELLPELDRYEEFDVRDPEKSLFVRKVRSVKLRDGSKTTAIVYYYNRDASGWSLIQGGRWKPEKN